MPFCHANYVTRSQLRTCIVGMWLWLFYFRREVDSWWFTLPVLHFTIENLYFCAEVDILVLCFTKNSVCITSARNGRRLSRTISETKKVKGKHPMIITMFCTWDHESPLGLPSHLSPPLQFLNEKPARTNYKPACKALLNPCALDFLFYEAWAFARIDKESVMFEFTGSFMIILSHYHTL